jgi:hypothetical protein
MGEAHDDSSSKGDTPMRFPIISRLVAGLLAVAFALVLLPGQSGARCPKGTTTQTTAGTQQATLQTGLQQQALLQAALQQTNAALAALPQTGSAQQTALQTALLQQQAALQAALQQTNAALANAQLAGQSSALSQLQQQRATAAAQLRALQGRRR